MCLTKCEYERHHNKDGYKLKGASEWDNHVAQGRQFGYVAKIIFKERMPISYHQICIC